MATTLSFDPAAELKKFEDDLERERNTLLEEQANRRADLVRSLILRTQAQTYGNGVEVQRAVIPRAVSPSIACGTAGTGDAGKVEKCGSCSRKGNCAKSHKEEEERSHDIASRMSIVAHKVVVMSTKGGVGKSMVSSQLAFALARMGHKVGIMDVDICGATVPKMTGKRGEGVLQTPEGLVPVEVNENLKAMSIGFLVDDENEAVIWRGPRKQGLIQTFLRDVNWGPTDYLIIDTPPGTSDEHLGTVQLLKATGVDGAILVTTPQDVSVIEVGKQIDFCRRVKIPVLGIVENYSQFVCSVCTGVTEVWPATSGGGRALAERNNVPFLGSVPLDPTLARLGEVGLSADPESAPGQVLSAIARKLSAALPPRTHSS